MKYIVFSLSALAFLSAATAVTANPHYSHDPIYFTNLNKVGR
jgi:hypothetical protein